MPAEGKPCDRIVVDQGKIGLARSGMMHCFLREEFLHVSPSEDLAPAFALQATDGYGDCRRQRCLDRLEIERLVERSQDRMQIPGPLFWSPGERQRLLKLSVLLHGLPAGNQISVLRRSLCRTT